MKSSTVPGKPHVVFATNVLVSTLLGKQGHSAKLFEQFLLGKIACFTSTEMLDELEGVLGREEITSRTDKVARTFLLMQYRRLTVLVKPKTAIKRVKEDPTDDKFLECAVEADARYLVSGDKHLTSLKKYKHIQILTPAEAEKKLWPLFWPKN